MINGVKKIFVIHVGIEIFVMKEKRETIPMVASL